MELLSQGCKTCAGDLRQYDEEYFRCENCGNLYAQEAARKYVATLRSLMDDAKREAVANARRNLYNAVTAEYISSEHVHECCVILKQLMPDDFQANFYELAIGSNGRRIAQAIRQIDVQEHACHMDALIRFLILSLQSEYILETGDLIERAYKKTDLAKYERYATRLSAEAQKLDDCIYMTAYPRDVFVAYSSKDMRQVFELVECLEGQGLSCFVAVRNLRHGKGSVEDYERALQEAMDNCKSFVFVSSLNSRHPGCDALKKEIPYIKRVDMMRAPAEYHGEYARIPHVYKKHRVEYRIQESPRPIAADRVINEFFDGYERVYSPEEVAERVLLSEIEREAAVPLAAEGTGAGSPKQTYAEAGASRSAEQRYSENHQAKSRPAESRPTYNWEDTISKVSQTVADNIERLEDTVSGLVTPNTSRPTVQQKRPTRSSTPPPMKKRNIYAVNNPDAAPPHRPETAHRPETPPPAEEPTAPEAPTEVKVAVKSKIVAMLLALFFGTYGVDCFYLGYVKRGIGRIIVMFVTCGLGSALWAICDFVRLATGKQATDARGNPLK